MSNNFFQGGDQDQAVQGLMNDIVKGVKAKMVDPVLNESRKLAGLLGEMHGQDQKELAEIRARLDRLEEAVRATPLLLLTATKEAINQAGANGKL